MMYTKILPSLLLLLFRVIAISSKGVVGDEPFLSFTNKDSNIGVELGFSIPLLKVPLEGVKRPEAAGTDKILSAPIEVNIPALAVAATMFVVASTALLPKLYQFLTPYLRPVTKEYWQRERDNPLTTSEDWKSVIDLDNNTESNHIPERFRFPLTSPEPRSTRRKLMKRFLKPHRFQSSCGTTLLPRTSANNGPQNDDDPK